MKSFLFVNKEEVVLFTKFKKIASALLIPMLNLFRWQLVNLLTLHNNSRFRQRNHCGFLLRKRLV